MSKNIYTWFACCLLALLTALPLSVNAQVFDFEDQTIPDTWTNDASHAWVITSSENHTEGGAYSIKSGNAGVNSTSSEIAMTVNLESAGTISFYCKISSESNWDKGYFYIDGTAQSDVNGISGNGEWIARSYDVSAGNHTFKWKFTKDSSGASNDDCFYVDDVTIDIPSCPKPSALTISEVTATSAKATWTAGGSESAWDISIDGGASRTSLSSTSRTFTGLTPNTEYTVSLRAKCGDNEYSGEVSTTFKTECNAIASSDLPWTEDFESYDGAVYNENGVMPECWGAAADGTIKPHVIGSGSYWYKHSGSKSLSFKGNGNCYAVLPIFEAALNTLQISFWYQYESASYGTLSLGYIKANDVNFNTFTLIENVPAKASSMAYYEKMLQTLPADAYKLVLRWYYNGGYACCVDDVNVKFLPTCIKPESVGVKNITTSSATLFWGEESTGDYLLSVKKDSIYLVGSAQSGAAVTGESYLLSNLEPATSYSLTVTLVKVCSATESSDSITKVVSFSTQCEAITELPYVESFENSESSSLPSVCWTRVQSYVYSGNTYPCIGAYSSSAYQGSKYLYFSGGASTSEQIIALPEISADLSNARIRFWYKNSGVSESSPSLILGKMSDVDDANSFVAIATLDKKSSYTAYEKELTTVGSDYHYLAFKYAGGTSTSYAYVDSIIIDAIPSCYPVVSLGISEEDGAITANSVLIEWAGHQGQNSSYLVTVKNGEEFISYNGEAYDNKLVNGNSLRIRGLESSKSYDLTVSIVAACAENDHSEVFTDHIVFNTLCEKISALPWRENFDGMTGVTSSHKLPTCWDYINTCTSSSYNYYPTVYNSTSYANSGSNSLRFYSYYSSYYSYDPQDQYAILPEMEGINGLRVKFNARAYSSSYDASIMLGVMSDPSDASTFELVTTLSPASTDYEEFIIPMNTYTGSGKYIAIKMLAADANSSYRGFCIDDIVVENIPSCLEPTGLTAIAESMRAHSALLTWVPQANESTWLMQYKKSSDSVWTAVSEPILSDTFRLEGLDAFTLYDVQVAAWCNPDNVDAKSPYCSTYSFMTSAGVPFDEEFGTSKPLGWAMYSGLLSDVQAGAELTNASYGWSFGAGNGVFDNHARSNIYGTSSMNWLVTPAVEIEDNVQLSFNLALTAYSGTLDAPATDGTDDKFVVLITEDGGATWSILRQWDNAGSANVYNNIACTANGQLELINLSSYSGKTVNIAFYGESTQSNADNNIHIDNVSIDYIPACPKATGLGVVDVTVEGATFFWDNISDGAWKYAVALASESEPAASAYIAITDTFVVINGKESDSEYIFYLRHDCGTEGLSPAISKAFHTLQLPADPSNFSDDFEAGNSWLFINGGLTNAWVWGEAAHNGEGTHALYISNDGGTSHAYNTSSAVVVYATKSFTFAEGSYTFEYDWLANGESTYDYLRVALVPASVTLSAATSLPAGLSTSAVPEGWIALDGGSKLNLQTAWQKFTSEEIPVAAGTYNVVLMWRDDTSGGSQTPAAVDNFSISRVLCSKLSQVVVADSTITSSSAVISWAVIDGQNAWQIALDTVSAFNPSEASLIAATSNPYTLNGLAADKRYYAYVRANCGADGFSAWSDKVSFKTAKACQTPDGIAAEVTDSSAVISWNTYGQSAFNLRYGQGSNWLDTIAVSAGSYTLAGLDANTSYNVQVQAACETTTWSTSYSFKTACAYVAAPWSEDFESMTASTIPECWDNSASTTSTLTGTNPHYVWGVYSDNGNKVLRMYNYYVSSGTALINTPNISLPASPTCELKFDYAHNATCGDLIVKISEDNGANWITLQSFTKSGSTDKDHAGTMTEVAISLADYAGKAVMLQFYTEANYGSGAIFVDNIAVNLKFCGDIANIHQTAATTNSASLAWDAVEAAIGYEYSVVAKDAEVDEANAVSVSSAEATISGLAHSSFYTVYVRSICSEGAGDWSSAIFNTECAVISSQEGYDNEENALIFDFEEYAAGKNLKDEILCWDVISGVWKTTSTHRSGSVGAYVAGLGAADTAAVLVTPAFEIIDGQELVAFVKEGYSHSDGDSVLFYINDAPSLEGATLIGKIEAADDWREFRKKLPEGWFTEEEVDEYDEAYILIQAYAYSAIYFDDIMLHEAPSCSKIMNIALEAETNALNVTWQAGADETMWAVSYSVKNAGNTWEGLVNDTPAIVINNLPASTADSLFITIQSLCDGGATPGEVVEAAFAFKTLCGEISEFPWTENFNDLISSMPDCWDNSEGTATYEWEVATSGHSGKSLTYDCYYNNDGEYSILATPIINLPEQEAELIFWHRNYAGGAYSVAISVNGGERQNLATLSGSSWTEKVIDLAAYAGSQVQFFFSGTSNYSSTSSAALYLDDVTVRIKPTCFAPTALEAVLTQGNGTIATLNWGAGKDETAWVVEYATSEDFGDALQVNASDSTVALVDLTPETTYYARVKAVCGEEDESIWSDAISFFPTNAYSVTIANGTTTNSNVPVYGTWVDHLMHSQFIIPADSLESIQYGSLTQLTFYASTANVDWAAARFEVYMAETSATSISALEDWASLTKVMNAGALSIVDGKMVVTLDTPFNYHNANLLVGFNQTVVGTYKSSSWYGVQLTGASVSNYDNGSVTQYSFLPKMTIGYLPGEPPACHQPSSVSIAALTATSASFVWESNADTCSVKLYNGTNLAADTLVAMAAMPFVINDLEPNTAYSFRFIVKGLCGEDGESEEKISTVSVHTLCAAEVIDDENWWAEDFNSLTQQYSIPDCWSNEEGTTTSSSYKWGAVGTGAVGSAYLSFNSYNNADGNTNVLATPMLTLPETPAQLVFLCKNPAGGDFNVAIAGEDGVRDTVLSNLTGIADWTEQKIMLGDYAGQTIRIFFNATSNYGTSAGNCYIDLDSVVINAAPNCMPVKNIEKFSVSENEVVFIWESNSDETQWDVLVTDNLHENAELFNASVDVRAISIALEANTKYSMHVSVVAHCSDEDMAEAVSADFIFRSPLSEDMIRVVENNTVDTIDLSDPDEQAKWTLLGADETNHFIFASFNENAGLYISNDGASWQYTTMDAPSAAIAYRAFSVPEDNTPVEISFKWQANGQSTIDYGRAFIAGAEAEFEIANHQAKINGVQMAANNAILGAYNLSTGASVVLSGVSTEQSLADDDYVLDAGQYYIVFAWRNNDDEGAQNSLGIYDLKIWNKKGYIPSAVDNITGEGVEVQKILHNGQVYILRDGVIYSILGTIVR